MLNVIRKISEFKESHPVLRFFLMIVTEYLRITFAVVDIKGDFEIIEPSMVLVIRRTFYTQRIYKC